MTDEFRYSVITFTPHPERGESFNLGVVVVSPDGEFRGVRYQRAYRSRLTALGPDVPAEAVELFMEDFRERFLRDRLFEDSIQEPTPLLTEYSDLHAGQVSFSPLRAAMGDSGAAVLNRLNERLLSPLGSASRPQVDRAVLKRTALSALRGWDVPQNRILENPSIPVRHGSNTLGVGVFGMNGNADRVVLAIEPISFALSTSEQILRQRDHLAWVASDLDRTVKTPRLVAFVEPPTRPNRKLFAESTELFASLEVSIVRHEGIDQLKEVAATSGALPSRGRLAE